MVTRQPPHCSIFDSPSWDADDANPRIVIVATFLIVINSLSLYSGLPRIDKGMVLLVGKGHFRTRNYLLRAHCTNCGQHILCSRCNIRGGPFERYVTFLCAHFTLQHIYFKPFE